MSSEDTQDFGILLNLAFGAFRQALDEDLAKAGFDDIGTSFGYVFRLLADRPCSLSELAQQLGMTAPGALKVVDDMVAKDYVLRRQDASDGRVKRLELTARGRAALARARRFHRKYEQALAARHGARQVEVTRSLLEAIAGPLAEKTGRLPRPA
jgi:DNA-binding MarR family transcriptional regulator